MGEGYNFKVLKQEILKRSSSTDWDVAKKEWDLIGIAEADEPETCLCGHFPIIEICTLKNKFTKNVVDVGNRCVNKFLGVRSTLLFAAIKRIRANSKKSLNEDAIVFFRYVGAINKWEYDFLTNTMRKRALSKAQMQKRISINERLLLAMKNHGLRGVLTTASNPPLAK